MSTETVIYVCPHCNREYDVNDPDIVECDMRWCNVIMCECEVSYIKETFGTEDDMCEDCAQEQVDEWASDRAQAGPNDYPY